MFSTNSHNSDSLNSQKQSFFGRNLVFRRRPTGRTFGRGQQNEDIEEILSRLNERRAVEGEELEISESISAETNRQINAIIKGQEYLGDLLTKVPLTDQRRTEISQQLDQIFGTIRDDYNLLNQTEEALSSVHSSMINNRVVTEDEAKLITGQSFREELKNTLNKLVHPGGGAAPKISLNQAQDIFRSGPTDFKTAIDALQTAGTILPDEHADLVFYGPKTTAQFEALTNPIYVRLQTQDTANNTKYYSTLAQLRGNKDKFEKDIDQKIGKFNRTAETISEELTRLFESTQEKLLRADKIEKLSRELGIPLRPGQKLYAEDWSVDLADSSTPRPQNQEIEILKVDYQNPDIISDPDLLHNYPSLVPVVHFKYIDRYTKKEVEKHLSEAAFRRYALSINLRESFTDQDELEKALGLQGKINKGQTFNFTAYQKNEKGETVQTDKIVKIIEIRKDKKTIILDQPVDIERDKPASGVYDPRNSNELDFGDFAKWFRRTDSVPEIKDLAELNEKLREFNEQICDQYQVPKEKFPPVNLNQAPPIVVSTYTENPETFVITEIGPNKIKMGSDKEMSYAAFFKNARRTFLGQAQPEKSKEMLDKLNAIPKTEAGITDPATTAALKKAQEEKAASDKAPSGKSLLLVTGPFKWAYKTFWSEANFISLAQLFTLFKVGKDKFLSKIKESREGSLNKVIQKFYKGKPYVGELSDEYMAKLTSATSKKIEERVKWMKDNEGASYVFKALYAVPQLSGEEAEIELKACLQFLGDKGLLREDDEQLHKSLNHVISATYPDTANIPKELRGEKIQIDLKLADKIPVREQIKMLLNRGWYSTAFQTYFGNNESKYRSNKSAVNEELHAYEFLSEGIEKEIQKRIFSFENGEDVDAAEFDGLLTGALSKDEVSEEQGLLLFLAAWGARHPKTGKSLLPYSKMYPYIREMKDNAPYLFFAFKHPLRDANGKIIIGDDGKPKKGHLGLNEFAYLYNTFAKPDIENKRAELRRLGKDPQSSEAYSAGRTMINFLHREILVHSDVVARIQDKANTQPAGFFHHLGPVLTDTNDIDSVLRRGYGGRDQANLAKTWYCGYSTHIAGRTENMKEALGKSPEDQEVAVKYFSDTLKSFSYFDSILNSRIKLKENYARFRPSDLDLKIRADKERKVSEFAGETQKFMLQFSRRLASRTGQARLQELADRIFSAAPITYDLVNEEEEYRDLLVKTVKNFGKSNLAELINMSQAVAQSIDMKGLSGAQATKEDLEKMKQEEKAKL